MPEINLDNLDAALIADVEQQYRDGLITRKDADRQIAYIQGGATKGLVDLMLGDHTK